MNPRRRIDALEVLRLLFVCAAAAGMTWFGVFGLYMSDADGGDRSWAYAELVAAAAMVGCAIAFLRTRERALLTFAMAGLVVPLLHVFAGY